MQQRFTFKKHERLTHRKVIDQLFQEGTALKQFPLMLLVLPNPLPTTEPLQVVVVVSKRNFKRAVDRNRIKRLMRESWRHHKHLVKDELTKEQMHFAVALVFNGKEIPPFTEVDAKISELCSRLKEDIPKFRDQGESSRNERL